MPTLDMTEDIPINLGFDFDSLSTTNNNKAAPTSSANSSYRNVQSSDDDSINISLENTDNWITNSYDEAKSQQNSVDKVRELEEEHARLSDSILTLSSQFARIQFRLQQITMAPPEKRDELLKQLHDYASTPCLDLTEIKQDTREIREKQQNGATLDHEIDEKRKRVLSLIRELKNQTEDLEKFAYENGGGELPTSQLKLRQKLVFDKLHEKIQLNIELEHLTEQELQNSVDNGIKQILEPIKEKEQLVDQLQTQIIDLENFVTFLQRESSENNTNGSGNPKPITINNSSTVNESPTKYSSARSLQSVNRGPPKRQSSIFGLIGVGNKKFEKNELKNTPRGNHYGDQRAHLEIVVNYVIEILKKYSIITLDMEEINTIPTDDEQRNQELFEWSEEEIVTTFRKDFCPALRGLLEHGMRNEILKESSLLNMGGFVVGCFPDRTGNKNNKNKNFEQKNSNGGNGGGGNGCSGGCQLTHIWDIILYFYEDRKLKELNDGSVGKLTQTFKLDNVSGKQITSKELLMYTIENIMSTHKRLKRTPDAMWKAFVSAAINERKLPGWIRIIFRADFIVSKCYHPWSYVAHTGCEDIRPLLERFHDYHIDLPVDLAIRPFEHIKDAF